MIQKKWETWLFRTQEWSMQSPAPREDENGIYLKGSGHFLQWRSWENKCTPSVAGKWLEFLCDLFSYQWIIGEYHGKSMCGSNGRLLQVKREKIQVWRVQISCPLLGILQESREDGKRSKRGVLEREIYSPGYIGWRGAWWKVRKAVGSMDWRLPTNWMLSKQKH